MLEQSDASLTDIAIIGMSLRVPGANTVSQFWRNLREGVESIRTRSEEELLAAGESPEKLRDKNYVPRAASLDGMEMFDPEFFGFGPQEAAIMDPQHRHFLECAWEAIENSARMPASLDGPVGVFAGCGMGSYFYFNICSNPKLVDQVGMFLLRHTGNDKDFLATRASHVFDLRGPSVNVQTACSTSLVAVHYACQSLINGECDMALAGGVTIELPHGRGYVYQDGEILSPDGHCRPFDHRAAGTVFGSGAGVVVLRRLADAIADGDPIRAVIKASAINNDGASKAGYLAPSVTGQSEAIVEAHTLAGVTADTLQYVECHGTGTSLGDPIEVEALTNAFRHSTDEKGFCYIGSVKSNIGHLDTAAGVVSLIKATLALENGEIPPTLGFEKPNPAINFAASPFRVSDRLTPWPPVTCPRRAAVNSLGVGGTNAHVVLEQAPFVQTIDAQAGDAEGQHVLVLSARNRKALEESGHRLADFLEANPDAALADVAYTLFNGRTHFQQRRAVAARHRAHAISALRATGRNAPTAHNPVENASPVFVFPGGGSQYPGMARALYRGEALFRQAVDEGLGYLPADTAAEIRALWLDEGTPEAERRFLNPALQLPAILITEVALARLWMSWGIKPAALIGHSMGENTAACIAGVLTFKHAVELVHLRGQLFTTVPPGGMLSIPLAEEELLKRLPDDLDLASVNGPELCVVSGENDKLDRFQAELSRDGIEAIRVQIDIAAHSRMLAPILERFEAFLKTVSLGAPRIPIVSNLTGTWLTEEQARNPAYWRDHLASTVRFARGLAVLAEDRTRIYIEVGPGRTMSSLVKAQGTINANQVINSLPHADEAADDQLHFLGAVGRAWATGLQVPLEKLFANGRRIPLPTYPFQHQAYWIAPGAEPRAVAGDGSFRHQTIEDWFYEPTWVRSPRLTGTATVLSERRWLVYSDGSSLASDLAAKLPGKVVVATAGAMMKKLAEGRWSLDLASSNQHQDLFDELGETGFTPTDVLYCCGFAEIEPLRKIVKKKVAGDEPLNANFFIPTFIARALGRFGEPINFNIITHGLAQVGNEAINPNRATLLGPILVAPREAPQLNTRCIDIEPARLGRLDKESIQTVLDELAAAPTDRVVAFRGKNRFVRSLHKLKLPAHEAGGEWLREGSVYLITGGLGGIGLEIAEHLARQKNVKLALLARSELPPEAEWDEILRMVPADSLGAQRIRRVRAIRALGSQVEIFRCDLADEASVAQALDKIRNTLTAVNVVIHAAGVMDDGPIENKSLSDMRRILEPKIAGANYLDKLIEEPLDAFILFSSVSSSLGLPGQVDYTAANAFLDAFALDRSTRKPGRTLVVNWNAWRDIGMTARASEEQQRGRAPSTVVAHPALDGYSDDSTGRTFVTDFTVDKYWLLSEHRIKNGMALLSGTAFVELARAAFSVGRAPEPLEIRDLTFQTPFQVEEGETRRLVIRVSPEGETREMTMRTAGDDPRSLGHVIGDVRPYTGDTPAPVDLAAIAARCVTEQNLSRGGTDNQHFVDFGPRWENIRSMRYGNSEALLELALDAKFAGDLEHYHLHPALLDMATGASQRLIPGFDEIGDFYVPVAYGRLRLFGRMPQHFYSHVRLRSETGNGEAFFDVTLVDPEGRVFCEISHFEMRRIDPSSALRAASMTSSQRAGTNTELEKVLQDAITPVEGLEAFDRIMAQPQLVQCIASSVDIEAWGRSLDAGDSAAPDALSDDESGFSRPDLDSEYEEPATETEKLLARIWSELLGIRRIGVHDDFFQLGGHSLHAVRLFASVKKHYGLSLPLSTLFETPSIRPLAALLDGQAPKQSSEAPKGEAVEAPAELGARAPAPKYSSLVTLQPAGTAPPFYCAAGMGGNPLNLRALAMEMGLDQPVYGLQPLGLDGLAKPHRTIPEMAAHYISEIRQKQPHGPYYLGGYSGGGVIAYEMAKQLTEAGETVGALVFLDSVAPGVVLPSALGRHMGALRQNGLRYMKVFADRAVKKVVHEIRVRGRKPLFRMFPYRFRLEHIEAAFWDAYTSYQPTPYDGDAVLFRPTNGFVLGVDIGPLNGWRSLVNGTIELDQCPGDHMTMCEQPNVRVLARRLRAYLRRQSREVEMQREAA
jgi:acyl transferase domain-containing protein/thioesterase domain-containing protein